MSESCDLGALVGAEEAREEGEEDLHRHHRLPQDPRPEHSLLAPTALSAPIHGISKPHPQQFLTV